MSEYFLESDGKRLDATDEQVAIIEHALLTDDNILINALAGAAKTTTLQFLCKYLPEEPTLSLAFNKRIAEEMRKKLPPHVQPMTLNAIGHKVWSSTLGRRLIVQSNKSYTVLVDYIKTQPKKTQQEYYDNFAEINKVVQQAKIKGYIPASFEKAGLMDRDTFFGTLDEDANVELIDRLLTESIRQAYIGVIDFDDQIYMSTLFGGTFPIYPRIMADEAQDFSHINHAMLEKLVNGRLFAVGDPWQAMYAFRGSVTGSMKRLEEKFNMTVMNLSVSFRCPQNVVRRAQSRVGWMKWADHAKEGRVQKLDRWTLGSIVDGSAVVCRNNAPLFKLALKLLANGRGVKVIGREIGPGLVKTLREVSKDDALLPHEVLAKLDDMETDLLNKGKNPDTLHDKFECLRVFAERGENLGQAIAYAKDIFAQEGPIQLLSGHKAKGLEWDVVYYLDPWRIPSKYATSKEDIEQEKNIDYVITTRAKDTLVLVNMGDLE
jgi:DNA helicase II / ATP-dependent DNA helicase PcrA